MNKHKSNKIIENSNTVRHLIMGQITTTQNLVAIKEVRHAGQSYSFGVHVHILWKPKLYSAVLLVAWNRWVLGHLQAQWSRPHIRTGSPPWCELFVAWSRPMASQNSVNIGSDNGLVPSGTKPLTEPVLTNHQWGHMAFTWGQFHRKYSRYLSLISVGKWLN